MTKVKLPEPVAWGVYVPALRSYELSKTKVETKYMDDGTVVYVAVPFITTTQAEDYADARVRAALEEAAEIAYRHNDFATYYVIRALIPSTPT